MARLIIDVPDCIADPKQLAKLEKALEGMQPGCVLVEVQHEEFCLARLGRGRCNCDCQLKVEKYV